MVSPSIIEIHPKLEVNVVCLKCHSANVDIVDLVFQGIHVLLDCACLDCNTSFFQTLPSAHDAQYPIAFSKDGHSVDYDSRAHIWLAKPLLKAMTEGYKGLFSIEKRILEARKEEAILLNCLDNCFGHAFAKLWNAQLLLESYPGHSIIVLISANLEWLVPKGITELWIVRGNLADMDRYVTNLHEFVKAEILDFRKFYLNLTKVFHDTSLINIESFTKVRGFEISRFDELDPCVTFVLREDRYWHGNKVEEFCNRALISLGIRKYFAKYFIIKQNSRVKKAIRIIRKQNPQVKLNITGLGNFGNFGSAVQDLREKRERITNDTEMEWCNVYSKSHVIVGIHGSNMLIPTSLSAGFIEILPEHKIPHIGEDTISHHAGRYAMLLGRHVDAFISPKLLAKHVLHMLHFGEIFKLVEPKN